MVKATDPHQQWRTNAQRPLISTGLRPKCLCAYDLLTTNAVRSWWEPLERPRYVLRVIEGMGEK